MSEEKAGAPRAQLLAGIGAMLLFLEGGHAH